MSYTSAPTHFQRRKELCNFSPKHHLPHFFSLWFFSLCSSHFLPSLWQVLKDSDTKSNIVWKKAKRAIGSGFLKKINHKERKFYLILALSKCFEPTVVYNSIKGSYSYLLSIATPLVTWLWSPLPRNKKSIFHHSKWLALAHKWHRSDSVPVRSLDLKKTRLFLFVLLCFHLWHEKSTSGLPTAHTVTQEENEQHRRQSWVTSAAPAGASLDQPAAGHAPAMNSWSQM